MLNGFPLNGAALNGIVTTGLLITGTVSMPSARLQAAPSTLQGVSATVRVTAPVLTAPLSFHITPAPCAGTMAATSARLRSTGIQLVAKVTPVRSMAVLSGVLHAPAGVALKGSIRTVSVLRPGLLRTVFYAAEISLPSSRLYGTLGTATALKGTVRATTARVLGIGTIVSTTTITGHSCLPSARLKGSVTLLQGIQIQGRISTISRVLSLMLQQNLIPAAGTVVLTDAVLTAQLRMKPPPTALTTEVLIVTALDTSIDVRPL